RTRTRRGCPSFTRACDARATQAAPGLRRALEGRERWLRLAAPAQEREVLAARAWSVRARAAREGSRLGAPRKRDHRDVVLRDLAAHRRDVDAVDRRGVQPEDLALHLGRERRVAV